MSSFKKAAKCNQKTHRERHQPESRAHLGLLEKKKDYKLRAEDAHAKEKILRTLKEKALARNPDEFYYHMINSRVRNGVHREVTDTREHTHEQKLLMETQDVKYVNMRRTMEAKKIERLQSNLHLIDAVNNCPNKHTFFVDTVKDAKEFDVVKHLDTHPSLLHCRSNRLKMSMLKGISLPEMDKVTVKAVKQERKRSYKELGQRIEREKQLAITEQKLAVKKQLLDKNVLPPKMVQKGTKDSPPVYFWPYDRKRNNPAQVHRLVPWLNREQNVLRVQNSCLMTVLDLILQRFPINSSEFRSRLLTFIGANTSHFVHTFYTFATSPYDMIEFDQSAVYEEPQCPYKFEIQSIGSDSDDDYVLSPESSTSNSLPSSSNRQPENTESVPLNLTANSLPPRNSSPVPGPSGYAERGNYSLLFNKISRVCSNSEDRERVPMPQEDTTRQEREVSKNDSDDCVIVGYVKPRHERTPEVITVDSDPEVGDRDSYREKFNESLPSTPSSSSTSTTSSDTSDFDFVPYPSKKTLPLKKRLSKQRVRLTSYDHNPPKRQVQSPSSDSESSGSSHHRSRRKKPNGSGRLKRNTSDDSRENKEEEEGNRLRDITRTLRKGRKSRKPSTPSSSSTSTFSSSTTSSDTSDLDSVPYPSKKTLPLKKRSCKKSKKRVRLTSSDHNLPKRQVQSPSSDSESSGSSHHRSRRKKPKGSGRLKRNTSDDSREYKEEEEGNRLRDITRTLRKGRKSRKEHYRKVQKKYSSESSQDYSRNYYEPTSTEDEMPSFASGSRPKLRSVIIKPAASNQQKEQSHSSAASSSRSSSRSYESRHNKYKPHRREENKKSSR